MKEKLINLAPYDADAADDVFSVLFMGSDMETENGLQEIPAASYQLLASGLELVLWELTGADRLAVKQAIGIVAGLRDMQKLREWNRKREAN